MKILESIIFMIRWRKIRKIMKKEMEVKIDLLSDEICREFEDTTEIDSIKFQKLMLCMDIANKLK